jgi:hypothetical protein
MAIGNTTGGASIFETLIRSAHTVQSPTPHPPPGTPPDPVPVPPVERLPLPVRDPPVRHSLAREFDQP